MKRETIAKILAVIITIVLVATLLSQISIGDVAKTLASIDPIYLIIGFVLYLFSYFFRALRFQILLGNKIGFKDLFTIVCVHNMANNILPARTGEVSYVYLSKKLHNISTGEGIASLMVARVFDLISISLLFFVAALYVRGLPPMIDKVIWAIAGFLLLIVLILVNLAYFGEQFMNRVGKIINMVSIGHIRGIPYLLRKGNETMQSFEVVKSKRVIIWTGILSMLVWASLYLVNYALINAMGINISFWSVIFVSTFPVFTTILPIQALGGFGTIEGGWTIGFMAIGLSKEIAIASGFSLHIIAYMYFFILGGFGTLMLKTK